MLYLRLQPRFEGAGIYTKTGALLEDDRSEDRNVGSLELLAAVEEAQLDEKTGLDNLGAIFSNILGSGIVYGNCRQIFRYDKKMQGV